MKKGWMRFIGKIYCDLLSEFRAPITSLERCLALYRQRIATKNRNQIARKKKNGIVILSWTLFSQPEGLTNHEKYTSVQFGGA